MAAPVNLRASPRAKTKTTSSKSAIRRHLDDFLRDLDDRPDMMDQVSEYLQHRPEWEKPRDLLPVDEMEQRLDLVEQFQTWKRTQLAAKADRDDDEEAQKQAAEWKLNRLAYAACMTMPLSLLVEYTIDHRALLTLDGALPQAVEAVRALLFAPEDKSSRINNPRKRSGTQLPETKKAGKRRIGSHERTGVDSGADSCPEESVHSAQDPPYQESKGRSQKARKKALLHDEGRCRISSSPRPEVTHIIPFSFSNSTSNTDRTMKFLRAFDLFGASTRASTLISGGGGLGEIDGLFNLVCLDRNLHSDFDKGYLGIKYLGRTDISGQSTTEITLQVVWMPMVKALGFSREDLIDLNNERDETLGFAYTIQSKADTAPGHKVFKIPGWPIVSGDRFTVLRPTGDAVDFVEMIKLRWHLGLVAAISGAAGDPDFIFGHDEEFEEQVRNYGRVRRQVDREMAEEALEYKNKMAAQGSSNVPARRPETPQPSMPGDLGDITNLPIRRRPGSRSKESSPTKTPTRSLTEARTRQQTAAGSDFSEQSAQVRGRSENTPSRENDGE